ncbi:MAG: DUF3107 family protein [Acidimicrobiia bacterium]|nr:DUF3107 family protein [Acidimicrobiia bacterium]NNF09263.1 DUF3107 family protein [Acidimicrobiia bacterium]
MRVRIALAETGHDVEVEVEDAEAFMKEFEEALGGARAVLWLDDPDGHKYGVAVSKIAFVHLEGERERIVGFA